MLLSSIPVKTLFRILGYCIFVIPLIWNLTSTIKEYRQFRVIEITEYEKVPYRPPDAILCFQYQTLHQRYLANLYSFLGSEANDKLFSNDTRMSKKDFFIRSVIIPLLIDSNFERLNWTSLFDDLRGAILRCRFEGQNCSMDYKDDPYVTMEDNFACTGWRTPYQDKPKPNICSTDRSGVIELEMNRTILKKYSSGQSSIFFSGSFPWIKNQLAQVKVPSVELRSLAGAKEAKVHLTLRLGTRLSVRGQGNRCGDPDKRGEKVQQFLPRLVRRYPYNKDLCALLERQKDYLSTCNCLNLHLPVPAEVTTNLSCYRLPKALYTTYNLILQISARRIIFKNIRNKVMANLSFDEPILRDLRCAQRVNRRQQTHPSFLVSKCAPSCQIEEYGRTQTVDLRFGSGDILHLSINPFSLDTPVVKEVLLFPPQTLMSNIGGMLGFWVGVSLITFVDFARWTFLKLFIYWRCRRQKVASEPQNTQQLEM